MGQTDWDDLCAQYGADDGLPVREVGAWSEDKLWFWHRYVQITTSAMVDKRAWKGGVAYVDLFAGPGICLVKETGKRLPGSPLIAAHAAKPLSRIIACELDPTLALACNQRLKRSPAADRAVVLAGDCNALIEDVAMHIPSSALTLAFIDPESLHVRFESVRRLSQAGAVDLLILFADAFDVVRNNRAYYLENPDSPLDRFLGTTSNWRVDWRHLGDHSGPKLRDMFLSVYQRQLRTLGYQYFGEERISGPSGPLYRLVYASKNDRGLDFWNKAKSKHRTGQGNLF